jgi:hypothetical protein
LQTSDATTQAFNLFVKKQLEICKNHTPKSFMLYNCITNM